MMDGLRLVVTFLVFFSVSLVFRLARTAERPSARLLVCLGGCPNYGPGAVTPCIPGAASAEVEPEALAAATDYFEDLGDRALAQVKSKHMKELFSFFFAIFHFFRTRQETRNNRGWNKVLVKEGSSFSMKQMNDRTKDVCRFL